MKITTTQLTQEQALHAIADGSQVLIIWKHGGMTEAFNLNERVLSCMTLGRGYLLIEETEEDEIGEEIAESQQNPAENCENAADPLENGTNQTENANYLPENEKKSQLDVSNPESEGYDLPLPAEQCEKLADMLEEDLTDVVTDPEISKAPITVEIPNSHKAEKERWRKIDDDMIINLRKSGLSERQIAEKMDTTQVTIHNHINKLRKEKRL